MDITSLKQQAITIRDENERSANSAARVGRAMLETVNAIEENKNNIATNATNIDTNAQGIATNKAAIATNKAALVALQTIYRGDLGDFTSWTEAQNVLDAMPSPNVASPNGQYQIRVGAVPFIVNYACLNTASAVYTQSVIGSAVIKSDGTLATSHGIAVNIFSRTYTDGAWGAWQRLAALSEVPTPQTGPAGNSRQYVYQDQKDGKKYVLCGIGKFFQNAGGLKFRLKIWGTNNNGYGDGNYSTFDCPQVTSGADGAMSRSVYGRLLNHSIYEGPSTATAVALSYTNFAESGNKYCTITAATTAKAGCMTVAHVNALNSLSSHIVDLGDFDNEEEALKRIGQLSVCTNKKLIHAHLTYSVSEAESTTLILIQSIDRDYCRQFIFNKGRVYTRGITFTDNTLSEISFTEDWTFMFADRLAWSAEKHGYLMSQFGTSYGADYCDPIPLATTTADGLMSKEDKQLLEKIKAQLNL